MARFLRIFFTLVLSLTPLLASAEVVPEIDPKPTPGANEMSSISPLFAGMKSMAVDGQEMLALMVGNDVYAGGALVKLSESIADDAYLGGAMVTVTSDVAGDLVIAGGNITVTGNVADDVRIAGGNIVIAGKVGGGLLVTGGTVQVLPGATIGDDIEIAGGAVDFAGTAQKNLTFTGGAFSLSGTIAGDAKLRAEDQLTFSEKAKISGTLTYSTRKEQTLRSDLASKIIYEPLRGEASPFTKDKLNEVRLFGELISWAIMFVTGLVLLALAGRQTARITEIARKRFWFAFLIGALLLALPLLVALLMFTVVGSALAIILFFAWLILLIAAGVFSGVVVGSFILPLNENSSYGRRVLVFVLGLAILSFVSFFVPVLGWALRFAVYVLTLGALVLSRCDLYKQLKKGKIF